MGRSVGAVRAVQSVLPEWAVPVVEALTFLGDPVWVLVLAPPVYWLGTRHGLLADWRDGARLIAVTFGALALVVFLKSTFALPRPPAALHLAHTDGYGFPSGHAVGATAAYGGLALLIDRGSRRLRVGVAATLIAVVAFTRVALGVHYLADVVAGVAVGGAYVLGAIRVSRASAGPAFGLATVAAALAVATAGLAFDAVVAIAGIAGAAGAWALLDRKSATLVTPRFSTAVIAVLCVATVAGAVVATEPPLPVVATVNIGVGAAVVGLPAVQKVSR